MRGAILGLLAVVGSAGTISAGPPPLTTGREGSPIEREFHVAPPLEPRPTEAVPAWPRARDPYELRSLVERVSRWFARAVQRD